MEHGDEERLHYGVRLRGGAGELAALHILTDTHAEMARVPWLEVSTAGSDGDAPLRLLLCPRLDAALARTLEERGLDMVAVREQAGTYFLGPEKVENPLLRPTRHLLEALRPLRQPGEPLAETAGFLMRKDSPAAQHLMERFLLLGRDDVLISEWLDDGVHLLLLQVPRPPLYLLMRAREEEAEGVRAYVRIGEGPLWVEWGHAYPLAARATVLLQAAQRAAFIDGGGRWRYAALPMKGRSLYDALTPSFTAARVDLLPAPGLSRFTVRLRLQSGPEGEAELWLLDAEQFLQLQALVDGATSDELLRFTVARTTGPRGTVYLLRELVRPGVPRLGSLVSDLCNAHGFARVMGTDNLYLPAGRRLVPAMRRDELRVLLQLDQAQVVVVDEDRDGPLVIAVRGAEEVPLQRWVEYVATDRRLELDRLAEQGVFEFPEFEVIRPPKPAAEDRPEGKEPVKSEDPPRAPRQRQPLPREHKSRLRPRESPGTPAAIEAGPADEAELRAEMHRCEKVIAAGGCADPDIWYTLGHLKGRFQELDEASACLEAALFHDGHGGERHDTARAELLHHRRHLLLSWTPGLANAPPLEEIFDLALREKWTSREAAYLGARVIDFVLSRTTPMEAAGAELEALLQQVVSVFLRRDLPVSRRLAWLVLLCCHRRAGDRLGLTRAKERVIGGLNDTGLSETYDLPGFVRFALALEGEGEAAERAQAERGQDQFSALERLWSLAEARYVEELDAQSAYLRLLFAMGFMRLGAAGRARDLVHPIEGEMPAHDLPNRVLFRLYLSRLALIATQGQESAWEREMETALSQVKGTPAEPSVEWLRKRSAWLRGAPQEEPEPWLRPTLAPLLAAAEARYDLLVDTLLRALGMREVFDYERVVVIERVLSGALRSGNDELLAEVLEAALRGLQQIQILGHRARAAGACIRAAAALQHAAYLDQLLDTVLDLSRQTKALSTRELMLAVGPGLLALRRLGLGEQAERFFTALAPAATRGEPSQGAPAQLLCALADGFMQLQAPERAEGFLDQALDAVLGDSLPYPERYEAGAAALDVLRHFPMAGRLVRCERLIQSLPHFRDTFTVSKYYATHQILIMERMMDVIADQATVRGDRARAFLDTEEQAVRRRILFDWAALCGR